MNRTFIILLSCLLFCATEIASAQGAANYYFPLRVGSVRTYRASSATWGARTVRETVDGTDVISGKQYHRLRGVEIMDSNPTDTVTYHVWWVRQDSAGNILLGAFAESVPSLGSAILIDPPAKFFPNEFLTLGHAQEIFLSGGGYYFQDSVMSTTETVVVPAGTFTNCIKKRERNSTPLGVPTMIEYVYYAQNIGEVRRVREIPVNEVHTQDLVQYNTVTAVKGTADMLNPATYALHQNYPNPFNPSTIIRFQLPADNHVTLKVYDLLGREVSVLVDGNKKAGYHDVAFDGSGLSSGVYYYRIQIGDAPAGSGQSFSLSRKFMILK